MVTRDQFRTELEELNSKIVGLAKLTGQLLDGAITSLYEQDLDKAKQIIENDKLVDKGELEINDKAVLLIAKQQPVAIDLRRIIMALRIVTDIERMADNAKNIAKSATHLGKNYNDFPSGIKKMHEMSNEMLTTAIAAFEKEDISKARKLAEMDDEVDDLYKKIVSELLGETATRPDKIQYVMQVAFSARYLERYADHITNIGESILYMIKGENYSLN